MDRPLKISSFFSQNLRGKTFLQNTCEIITTTKYYLTKSMSLNSRSFSNLFLFGVCLNFIGKARAFGFRCAFFIKGGHLFTFLLIFPPFHSPYSSVLSDLWKSLNLCLKLYLICSSSTVSLSEFIQMDKEEDAFDISAVPGRCSRSLAKSYKREVILGRVWVCMCCFGLAYSHSGWGVFEYLLWCISNIAVCNFFQAKKTGCCHWERESACPHGSCVSYGSLQGQN